MDGPVKLEAPTDRQAFTDKDGKLSGYGHRWNLSVFYRLGGYEDSVYRALGVGFTGLTAASMVSQRVDGLEAATAGLQGALAGLRGDPRLDDAVKALELSIAAFVQVQARSIGENDKRLGDVERLLASLGARLTKATQAVQIQVTEMQQDVVAGQKLQTGSIQRIGTEQLQLSDDIQEVQDTFQTQARASFSATSGIDYTQATGVFALNAATVEGLADGRITAASGAAGGIAPLDGSSKVPTSYLPALALTDVYVVASQAAQLALTAQEGDVAVRSDQNKSYIHNGGTAGTMADWQELLTPTDSVLSVDGLTGAVSLPNATTSTAGKMSAADKTAFDAQYTAWTAYTPTITAGAGSFTSANASGRYKQVGKTVFFSIDCNIVTNGTASSHFNVTLPFTSRSGLQSCSGNENQAAGFACAGSILSSSTTLQVQKYDASYAGGSGYRITMQGSYETA